MSPATASVMTGAILLVTAVTAGAWSALRGAIPSLRDPRLAKARLGGMHPLPVYSYSWRAVTWTIDWMERDAFISSAHELAGLARIAHSR